MKSNPICNCTYEIIPEGAVGNSEEIIYKRGNFVVLSSNPDPNMYYSNQIQCKGHKKITWCSDEMIETLKKLHMIK